MRESGPSRLLVGRPYVVPDIDRNQRQAAVLRKNDLQSVGKAIFFEGNAWASLGGGGGRMKRNCQSAGRQYPCRHHFLISRSRLARGAKTRGNAACRLPSATGTVPFRCGRACTARGGRHPSEGRSRGLRPTFPYTPPAQLQRTRAR